MLVIAGEADVVIPLQDSVRLFEAAREPKRLHIVPGADHNDYELNAGEAIIDVMLEFLDDNVE